MPLQISYSYWYSVPKLKGGRGGTRPPIEIPSIEIWALDDETIKSQPARINSTNSGQIKSQIVVKTFFLVFT